MTIKPEAPKKTSSRSTVYTPELLETLRANPGTSYRIGDGYTSRPSTWAPRQNKGNGDLRLKTVLDEDGTYILYGMSVKGMKKSGADRFEDYLPAE